MTPTFETTRARTRKWRRELTPVIAVAALAADYLSPAALWTILLPFAGVVLLLALRKPVVAAMVFVMSSWVLIPSAANLVIAVAAARGNYELVTDERSSSASAPSSLAPVFPGVASRGFAANGSRAPVNPRWALRRAIEAFADYHNELALERFDRTCR